MTLGNMTGLAYNLRNISSGNITFMTIPFAAAKSDPNRVEWTSEADVVWANMVNDVPALGEAPAPAPTETTAPAPGATATTPVEPATPVAPRPGRDEEGRARGVQRRRHDGRLLRHGCRRADHPDAPAELRARARLRAPRARRTPSRSWSAARRARPRPSALPRPAPG